MSNLKPENEISLRSTLLAKLNKIETLSAGSEVILVDSLFDDIPAQVYYNTVCQTPRFILSFISKNFKNFRFVNTVCKY